MDAFQAEELLRAIGSGRIKARAGWVTASCPFALWLHPKGCDRHPSFAVSIVPGGTSRYRCLSCGESGSVGSSFLWRLRKVTGRDYSRLSAFADRTNAPSLADLSARLALAAAGPRPPVDVGGVCVCASRVPVDFALMDELPEDTLQVFEPPSGEVLSYLETEAPVRHGGEDFKGRGLPAGTLARWEVGWHRGASRISIPLRNMAGKLVGVSGRAWPLHTKPKYLHPSGFKRDQFLYGECFLVRGRRAVLVEGQFDVMKLDSFGYVNVLGQLGAYLSSWQIEKVVQACGSALIVPDGDDAGRKGAALSVKMMAPHAPVVVAATPDGIDPGEFTPELARHLLGPP